MRIFSILSITLASVISTLVAQGTDENYQEAVQVLNSIPYDELNGDESQTAENADDYISDLWTDIENAFRFLEERNVENELRRLRMMEISKRLPGRRHSFVRFGKRYQPSHSFVRFGRSGPGSSSHQDKSLARLNEEAGGEEPSTFSYLMGLSDPLDAETSPKRHKLVVRVGRSADDEDALSSQENETLGSNGTVLDAPTLISLLKRKFPSNVRIGKLPASLYLYHQNASKSSPVKQQSPSVNNLPRYG
ncbi:hypothetical protein BgiMline_024644 [Biomphalaria glabrata]|nr:hypothetical protein BgiMline_007817 [Biomphalaria glabrata]